jgi:RNA polymerase sigma-70 factor, ECF subfamily
VLMKSGASPSQEHLIFEREVAHCRRELYPAALRMTRNPSDAEDLVQETMTRAYAGMRHYTPGTNARAWLYRIMSNTFINGCRKRQREPIQVLSPGLGVAHAACASDAARNPVSTAPSAETEVLDRFTYSDFRDAIAELPECFRAAVYLADIEGYSYKDISVMMDVPIGTVMSRLSRARCRLRKRLAAYAPGLPAESVAVLYEINRFRSSRNAQTKNIRCWFNSQANSGRPWTRVPAGLLSAPDS